MKKSIFSSILLLSLLATRSFGMVVIPPDDTKPTTLIVNANVTVVLVNNDNAGLQVTGSEAFKKFIKIRQIGDSVIIATKRDRDFKDAGTIYIPAGKLKTIQVNSPAYVKSVAPLTTPVLTVIVNGACRLAVSNIGEFNLVETESYVFEKNIELRRVPESTLISKND